MQKIEVNGNSLLKEGNKYLLSFINKEKYDISFNVNGRIRNALSNLNKEITITDYFSTRNDETGEYFVYFRVQDLNNDDYSINQIKDYIISNSSMSGVDLKYNYAFIVDGQVQEEDLKADIRDFFDIPAGQDLPLEQIKNIMYTATALYALAIIKDLTE